MDRYAVIVAGGRGSRMQSELPKQFMLLLDLPVLMHTIERFVMAYDDIHLILVLPKDQVAFWKNLCAQMDFSIDHEIAEGGETRFESVKKGLALCPGEGLVAIHDGVRPLVTPDLIQRCFIQAAEHGSALPVIPLSQSIRKTENGTNHSMSRDGLVAVQTPQCFRLSKLKPCYDLPYNPSFTDDATVFESAGYKVHLVEGEATNLKITTPEDLKIAEAILASSQG